MLSGRRVSRTRKDSNQATKTVLELVKRDDGTFDLLLNSKLDRSHIAERWLPDELCVRFGFCGQEYDSILREAKRNGTNGLKVVSLDRKCLGATLPALSTLPRGISDQG
jgi:hypothetical protein